MIFQDWTPDGKSALFTRWSLSGGSAVTLWRVPVAGGEPEPLGLSLEGLRDVSVHPEGGKLTFTAGWPRAEVWVMENVMGAGR
jgi:hypothetical protein